MASMLPEDIKKEVKEKFKISLKNPVNITYFTMELECQSCQQTHELLNEIVSLSDLISLSVFKFDIDKEKVKEYNIEKIPAIVIMSDKDYGIRFYGLPSGYEFASLLEAVIMVSKQETGLKEESLQKIAKLSKPVHIQVFVTNTCPYCTNAVQFAHKLAFVSDNIRADEIDASEFVTLSQKYNVSSVPKVVINEKITFVGALPEDSFVNEVLAAEKL
ncbi:thioredoxin family protein [candidate division WOR-3 bacterium]|nr:thioredoxin family protein [candidate division WOR-3 bacterium]